MRPPTPLPPSPNPTAVPDFGSIVIDNTPPTGESLSDLWIIRPPYDHPAPLRQHTEEYDFCCGIWSPDGEHLAYIRTSLTNPASTVRVWSPGENTDQQVGGTYSAVGLPRGIRSIALFGWSSDGDFIFIYSKRFLYSLPFPDGATQRIDLGSSLPSNWAAMDDLPAYTADYAQATSGIVFWRATPGTWVTEPSGIGYLTEGTVHFAYLSIADPSNPSVLFLLDPPAEYFPVEPPYSLRSVRGMMAGTSVSPDGKAILFAGRDTDFPTERLWLWDAVSNNWRILLQRQVKLIQDQVSWSPDGRWAAWWAAGTFGYKITFLDSRNWQVSRTLDRLESPDSPILGWTRNAVGLPHFAVLDSETGLTLYDPDGQIQSDIVLVPITTVTEGLPFAPYETEAWSWQPR
jgi:hypothetical protein